MVDLIILVAMYGAGLSTVLAILELYRFRIEQKEKSPRIEVKISLGFVTQGSATSPIVMYCTATNPGNKSVTINIPSLLLPNDKKVFLLGGERVVSFPFELLPGKNCVVWEDIKQLARGLMQNGYSGKVDIVCEFQDAVGNSYKSRSFSFDVDHWAK